MNDTGVALAYRESTARGASAVGRVVALFDTILRDFRRALVAIDAGNVQTRVFEMNHALTVIGELQGVLNFEQGGEAAKQFERFYNVARGMILNANVQVSRESVLALVGLFQPIRQAWHEVDNKIAGIEPIEARLSGGSKNSNAPLRQNKSVQTTASDKPSASWSA